VNGKYRCASRTMNVSRLMYRVRASVVDSFNSGYVLGNERLLLRVTAEDGMDTRGCRSDAMETSLLTGIRTVAAKAIWFRFSVVQPGVQVVLRRRMLSSRFDSLMSSELSVNVSSCVPERD